MRPDEIKLRIEALSPDTRVEVVDLTGIQKVFLAKISSPLFWNKSETEQQRMVFDLFRVEVDSEEIHALTLQTEMRVPDVVSREGSLDGPPDKAL